MNTKRIVLFLGLEGFLELVLLLYLNKFPIFPEYQSGDFIQHVRIAGSYAAGNVGTLSSNLLYGDIEFYLAAFIKLLPTVPAIQVTRDAMGLLVLVSLPVVFLSTKAITENEVLALVCSLLYVLGGVWFTLVFNSGLYANFAGLLASLMLAGGAVWATKGGFDARKVGVLALFLSFAVFSHYSTLLVFPAILTYLGFVAFKHPIRRKAAVCCFLLIAFPMILGASLFSSEVSTLLGFLQANGIGAPPTSDFSQALLAIPVIGYMVAELTFDIGAVVLLILAGLSVILILKNGNEKMLIPALWFITILVVSPFNATAWRFAFVGLVPLMILAAYPLARLYESTVGNLGRKDWRIADLKRYTGVYFLLFLVVSGGWVFRPGVPQGVFMDGTTDTAAIASFQQQELAAMAWMRDGTTWTCGYETNYQGFNHPVSCLFLALTDWHFLYSIDMGGPSVEYDPTFASAPEIASFHALTQRESYLIVTNVTSSQALAQGMPGFGPCVSASLVTLTALNYSSSGAVLKVHLFSVNETVSNAALFVNGHQIGTSPMSNNSAIADLAFNKEGTYSVQAEVGTIYSNSLVFTVGGVGPMAAPENIQTIDNSCIPFDWTSAQLAGATLAWNSTLIRIWKLTS